MSAALRNNTVSRIFPSSTHNTQIDLFTQTLNTLELSSNKIGEKGAEHLSAALRDTTVSGVFSFLTQKTQIDFFTQALTELNLWKNQIGDKGAEHLSAALRNNTVSGVFLLQYKRHRSIFSHRHSKRSIYNSIKSKIKEQNICLRHFETTQ